MKKKKHYVLFQFDAFVEESLESEKHHDSIVKYGKAFENLQDMALEDTTFYKDYLSKFDVSGFEIKAPEELKDDFDFELLTRLIAASFSSDYVLSLDDTWKDNPDASDEPLANVTIFVETNNKSQKKTLQELWSFQVLRLFEIYLIEQIDLAVVYAEGGKDEDGVNGVTMERLKRLKKFEEQKQLLLKSAEWFRSNKNV